MFPALNIKREPPSKFSRSNISSTSAIIEWQWFLLNEFGESTGYGLSNVGNLATTTDKQALLGCWAIFEFLVEVPQPNHTLSASGSAFHTTTQTSEISWIMRKQCIDTTMRPDPKNIPQAKSSPIFRSEDFRSTLGIGWIPDSGLDFFTLFVIDLHKKWRLILESADLHLSINREMLLRKKGRTIGFIDNLLLDAQQWTNFRVLLQTHVRKAKDLVQDFKERRYLCDEVSLQDKEGVQNKRKRSARDLAIGKLSKAIQRMENEVEGEIKKLDQKTKEMIELEFNLVSIYEARTSKTMRMSMKRLSWITFIFLPLIFVASLFGMNVDLISGGPRWWWAIVLGASVFVLVISVWALLKLIRVDEWLEDEDSATIATKLKTLSGNLGRGLQKLAKRGRSDNLESGPMGTSGASQFKPPTRQWTKLKDL